MCKSLSFKNGVMVPENTGRKLYKECHLKMIVPILEKAKETEWSICISVSILF